MAHTTYRADLDGLRAVAVTGVLLYHLGVTWLPGGFAGVDVFFVLSGFLITRIIHREMQSGHFSLIGFYDRRIRRIFPALFLVFAATSLFAVVVLLPHELEDYAASLAAASLSAGNFWFYGLSGYFAPKAELQPLLHTWSLGIEEQFYLVAPAFLMGLTRYFPRCVRPAFLVASAVSLTANLALTPTASEFTFFLLPARMWELLLGSMIALGMTPKGSRAAREALGITGLLLIWGFMFLFPARASFPGLAAVAPCLGAALVIWSSNDECDCPAAVGRLLGLAPLVFIGLISYSIYLWHWPIIVFARLLTAKSFTPDVEAAIVILTLTLSVGSWWLVERPLRAGGFPWPRVWHRYAAGLGTAAVFACLGFAMLRTGGMPWRLPDNVVAIANAAGDFSPERKRCHADGIEPKRLSEACVLGARVPPKVTVWSDSHGVEVSMALAEVARSRNESIRQFTFSGCPPSLGAKPKLRPGCDKVVDAALREFASAEPTTVLLAAYYDYYAYLPNFFDGVTDVVRALRKAGHRVVVMGGVPNHPNDFPVPAAVARWALLGTAPNQYRFSTTKEAIERHDQVLKSGVRTAGACFYSVSKLLCPDLDGCRAAFDGHIMYFDDSHLSVEGARRVVGSGLADLLFDSDKVAQCPTE